RAFGALQTGDALSLQLTGDLHAFCDRAKSNGSHGARVSSSETLRAAWFQESSLGKQPARNQCRCLWIVGAHGRDRTVRRTLPAQRTMEWQAVDSVHMGGAGDRDTNF